MFSCKHKREEFAPIEYVKWVENTSNGLKKIKKIDDIRFDLQYRPVDYIAVLEERSKQMDQKKLNSKREQLKGLDYFLVRISAEHCSDIVNYRISDQQDYLKRNDYLSFAFQNDIKLVEGSDTIPCALFNFAHTYGVAPYADFLFAFERRKKEECDKTIIIDDNIFGCGTIKFLFQKQELENIPTLITY